jgi:hypothetical protein
VRSRLKPNPIFISARFSPNACKNPTRIIHYLAMSSLQWRGQYRKR